MIIKMDIQDMQFDKLNILKSGRNMRLVYNKSNIELKTPELYLPFSINKYKKQWMNYEEYSIDCYVNDCSSLNKNFSDQLIKLDENIYNISKENIQLLGGTSNDVVSYSKMYRDNKDYPKLLKLYLPRDNNGNFTTHFFDENGKVIHITEQNIDTILHKKSIFKTLITSSKVWYYQNKIGSTWNILQLKVLKSDESSNLEETDDRTKNIYNNFSLIE